MKRTAKPRKNTLNMKGSKKTESDQSNDESEHISLSETISILQSDTESESKEIKKKKKVQYPKKEKKDKSCPKKLIGKKRERDELYVPYEQNRKSSISNSKNGLIFPKKKSENNSKNEINYCYDKLYNIISNNSFSEVSRIILGLNNNLIDDVKDSDIFKEIKRAISPIRKKEDIVMLCLNILAKKNMFSEGELQDQNNDTIRIKIKKKISKKKEPIKNEQIKIEDELRIKGIKNNFVKTNERKQQKYVFKSHYYNDYENNIIYRYNSIFQKPKYTETLVCKEYFDGCKAKCGVFLHKNQFELIGEHNHVNGINNKDFYKMFPELINKKWRHIQVAKVKDENGETIVLY